MGIRRIAALVLLLVWGAFAPPHAVAYEPSYAKAPAVPDNRVEYLFAVHPLHNPRRLFEVYQPLVERLNAAAAPKFSVKLETSRDYASFEQKLGRRKFHFAVPNPYQTLDSEQNGYRIIGKMGNDSRFRGIIITRRDTVLASVMDLKGAAISFPAPTALAATMMPRMFLYRHGLAPDDINARYVGSQESAIMNVLLGRTVAAGTWPPPWEALLRRRPEIDKELEVKWETDPLVNNSLVVRNDVPEQHIEIVKSVLLSLHEQREGRLILEAMEIGRFETADTTTFDPVRRFLQEYETVFGRMP